MSFALLLPAALAALLALALPLLIHLARREQQRDTMFAALRWLRENPKPRRRIRFDELLLLLLRLLLLATLALWLARPVLTGAQSPAQWTVVVPGVADVEVQALSQSGDDETRWLAEGYPSLLEPMPSRAQPTGSLLRQLDTELPPATALRVLVPERLAGMDGGDLRLSREVDWRIVAGDATGDATPAQRPPKLHVRHDEAAVDAVRYLRAATLAPWPDVDPADIFDAAPTDTPWPADARRIAWLADGALPPALLQWIDAGGEVLLGASVDVTPSQGQATVVWRDAAGDALVEAASQGRGRVLQLRKALHPADMPVLLSPEFPQQLQALFEPPPVPAAAWAASHVPLTGAVATPPAPRELRPWLALLIALLLLAERWLATTARREVRA